MTNYTQYEHILIVDDTPSNIDVLKELLSDYKRSFALDGKKALERIRSNPPDLVLLDVMMPEMDGFEVCKRLKADDSTRDIPIIFITALDDPDSEVKGLELGAVDYISKPFQPAIVKSRVQTHLTLKRAKEVLDHHNAILEQEVAERTIELRNALKRLKEASVETIHRLSKTAEYKDDDTAAHIIRMSHYSEAVARQLGLSEKDCELILHAAPLHDIGKIGIPDRILLKPGKLTPDEWTLMKKHCEMGARILAGSKAEVIQWGETVAITHHESWDGMGYPRGLKGEEIPLVGRIVAIADVFDALTSKRPYKEPFSLERSYRIISEERDSHFDPDVVDAFFVAEAEILEIKERFSDEGAGLFMSLARLDQK